MAERNRLVTLAIEVTKGRLPVVAAIVLINVLVSHNGLTVIVRLGNLPILGHTDITLEATVYGAILGLRAVALILCGILYTLAVDPDEVLRLFRRVSFRSALSATLATRMVPILIRDGRRLAEARDQAEHVHHFFVAHLECVAGDGAAGDEVAGQQIAAVARVVREQLRGSPIKVPRVAAAEADRRHAAVAHLRCSECDVDR